jgi:uncharacterized protein YpmS
MKWIKRIFIFLLILAIGLAALLGTSYYLIRRTPDWYKPLAMNSEEMQAAANRAFNKVTVIHNMANEAAARESAASHNAGAATRPDVQPITITFTQDELSAFILRWTDANSEKTDRYIKGPQFVLRDSQIIFGGQIAELGQFGAIQLEPSLDEKGLLHLDIAEIRAGQLRVPQAFIESHLAKARTTLEQWLPAWQQNARIDVRGANSDAVKAAMTELLLNTLRDKPSQPVFFMPTVDRKIVPVKLTDVSISNGSITLTVQPLTPADRKIALDAIREPYGTATAQNH